MPIGRLWMLVLGAAILWGLPAAAQPDTGPTGYILEGRVTDFETGEPLSGATVYVARLETGTTTDADGSYRLLLPADETHRVRYSYVGYAPIMRTVRMYAERSLSIELSPEEELGEVTVTAPANAAVLEPLTGVNRVGIDELRELPQFLGETDVNRGLLLLPGVTSVGDGASGFNVRGGNVDQNLLLLDGSQVFFSSHLFGLFSVFNPDLLEDVTLYKGSIPARYGGRVSSVVDIRQRPAEGDRVRGAAGIGFTASRFAIEAPLAGEAVRLIAGGRASYLNWLLGLAGRSDVKASRASYQDAGARLDVRASTRLQGALTGYFSRDGFRFDSDTSYTYQTLNLAGSTLWSATDRLAVRTEGALTDYAYGFKGEAEGFGYDYRARVLHARALVGAVGTLGAQTVEGGIEADYYRTQPGSLTPRGASAINEVSVEDQRGVGLGAYLSGAVDRGGLRAEVGLRYSLWSTLGPALVPVLDPALPRGPAGIVRIDTYASGDVVAQYGGFEPRLALRYAFGDSMSVKAGYDRLRQYVHLISNTTAATPVDQWAMSDPNVPPQVSDQLSVGFNRVLPFALSATVEGYYKWIHSVPDYRPGARLLLNPLLSADLLEGRGRAYGVELMLRRQTGTLTGWISYTLSRAERVAEGTGVSDEINFGEFYPANFDRPHDLALAFTWHNTPRIRWGFNFVYSSGRPITYPTGVYRLGDLVVPSYTLRNQARIPDYHRLDFSLSVDEPRRPGSRSSARWTFNVYNIYNRRNAYSVFFRQLPGTSVPQPYRLSTLGSIFPSLSYEIQF